MLLKSLPSNASSVDHKEDYKTDDTEDPPPYMDVMLYPPMYSDYPPPEYYLPPPRIPSAPSECSVYLRPFNKPKVNLHKVKELVVLGTVKSCVFDSKCNQFGEPEHFYIKTNSMVLKYNLKGNFLRNWKSVFNSHAGGLCIDSRRDLLVAGAGTRVTRETRLGQDPGLSYAKSVRVPAVDSIASLAYYPPTDKYIVCNPTHGQVCMISPVTGTIKMVFSNGKGSKGSISQPVNVNYNDASPVQHIVVSDTLDHQIKLFNVKGKLICSLGCMGDGQCQLMHPKGVVVDRHGNVVVCDHGNKRVIRFLRNEKGNDWRWECVLSPDQLNYMGPDQVDISASGHLIVTLSDPDGVCDTCCIYRGYYLP